jgi:hypothetical protein
MFDSSNRHSHRLRSPALALCALSLAGCSEPSGGAPELAAAPAGLSAFYDVVVVGAGTGGSAAAIQAARLGVRVALLEETDCVGGQMNCAGVTSMDEGALAERSDGIYKEFVDRIRSAYGARPIGTCYWSAGGVCFEPNVGQAVLRQMLSEAGVQLFTREQVISFAGNGGLFPFVTTIQGDLFQARVIIDATEYGDLLPLAGVDYRVGNSRAAFGINPGACVQDITYTAVIKKYPGGVPAGLVITHPPEPADGNPADSYANAAAKFRQYITFNGTTTFGGGTPPAPPYPYSWAVHSAYRGMPDSSNPSFYTGVQQDSITKTGVNWANDFPYTAGSLDRANRFAQNCRAKLQTLQFIYYAQTELGQPLWSVANDTGYDSPWNIQENSCPNIATDLKELEKRMPPIPYVRESRRLIGLNTVAGHDILRVSTVSGVMANRSWHDAIAVGDYPNDLHHCNAAGTLEADLETISDLQSGVGGPFQIPMSALIPQSVDGLIAAEKNFSQSRLVSAASRLQPSTMLIGQGAGALAAFAVRDGVTPRNVPPGQVQSALLDAGHRTSRFDYADVFRGDPSWKAAQTTSTYDVMIGFGGSPPAFGPATTMLRRDAATSVSRLAGFDTTPPATATFTDVPTGDAQFGVIEALWREGLTTVCTANAGVRTYCPNDPVTRGQLAVFLSRAFGITQTNGGQSFADVPPGHVYYPFIQALATAGLAEPCPGQPGNFCPDAQIARGDAAAMFARFLLAGRQTPPGPTITVATGSYGGNAGAASGNVTGHLAASCNGRSACNYSVSFTVLGDPVPGIAKDYLAEWTCSAGGTIHRAWAAAEAGFGSVVHLACP